MLPTQRLFPLGHPMLKILELLPATLALPFQIGLRLEGEFLGLKFGLLAFRFCFLLGLAQDPFG